MPALPAQPRTVEAETRRLVFQVSPVPQSGDAAAQARQCLKSFRGAQVVKLRAFVVGAENVEPVRQAIEAEFRKRRQPAPSLSVIVIGALPHADARVLIEAVSIAKSAVNPGGVAFIAQLLARRAHRLAARGLLRSHSLARLAGAGCEARFHAIGTGAPGGRRFDQAGGDVAALPGLASGFGFYPQHALRFLRQVAPTREHLASV